jgi:hypothetical protein
VTLHRARRAAGHARANEAVLPHDLQPQRQLSPAAAAIVSLAAAQ